MPPRKPSRDRKEATKPKRVLKKATKGTPRRPYEIWVDHSAHANRRFLIIASTPGAMKRSTCVSIRSAQAAITRLKNRYGEPTAIYGLDFLKADS